jgi:hypothetical protein
MRDSIFLVCDQGGIRRMTKSAPSLKPGEIPVKLDVTVDRDAFITPVIEQKIHITDWRPSRTALTAAVKEGTITRADADVIVADLLSGMIDALERAGYTVTAPSGGDGAEGGAFGYGGPNESGASPGWPR